MLFSNLNDYSNRKNSYMWGSEHNLPFLCEKFLYGECCRGKILESLKIVLS